MRYNRKYLTVECNFTTLNPPEEHDVADDVAGFVAAVKSYRH